MEIETGRTPGQQVISISLTTLVLARLLVVTRCHPKQRKNLRLVCEHRTEALWEICGIGVTHRALVQPAKLPPPPALTFVLIFMCFSLRWLIWNGI